MEEKFITVGELKKMLEDNSDKINDNDVLVLCRRRTDNDGYCLSTVTNIGISHSDFEDTDALAFGCHLEYDVQDLSGISTDILLDKTDRE